MYLITLEYYKTDIDGSTRKTSSSLRMTEGDRVDIALDNEMRRICANAGSTNEVVEVGFNSETETLKVVMNNTEDGTVKTVEGKIAGKITSDY